LITKRNSQCTCGSGKKFKHCCIELYNERLKWNSLEESLRNKIQEYWEKFYHDQYIEDAIATFDKDIDFKDISERRLFFDWFIHDYIIKDSGKSSTTIIQKFVKNCHDYIDKEEEKNTLKLWADSAFRFYEVLDIKKGSGYTVTDVFGDQDKHLFLFDHSSSFTINKYDILYTMLYKVGDILRPSGGLMVSPRRFLPFIKEYVMNTFQKFQSKYKRNIESRTNVEHENLYLNDYFRKESVSIIKYLDSLNSYPTITTAQGDLLVLSRSSFLIKNKRRFLSMLDSSKDFIELENEGNEVRYDWVEELDEGNISFLNNINNKDINNSDEEKQESNLSYQSEEIALHTILWVSVDDDNIQEHENIFN